MKLKNIILTLIGAPIVVIGAVIALWLLYSYGPIPILRLTPYEMEQRRTVFPQWINNDEICYIELVLHRDKTVFEGGKFILFIKAPIMDIYIYREKINHPETKKLIKHIARRHIQPSQSLEGSLDTALGFRIYDNGKKLFLYYYPYPYRYHYITMAINGRWLKDRIIKMQPFDISQDGTKIYGIIEEDLDKYAIAEYVIKNKKIKKLMDISGDKFQQTFRARINDLKLLAQDKLLFSYEKDVNKPGIADYVYLIDILTGKAEFVCDPSTAYFGDAMPYYEDYMFDPHQGITLAKNGKVLILGIAGVYSKITDNWTKIKPFFYKEYPAISPDGKKVAYFDILTKRGELNSIWFVGRELKVININDLLKGTDVQHE